MLAYSGITSIVIPDSVTTIYSKAFEGCNNLQTVIIPDSVREMYDAFVIYTKIKQIIYLGTEEYWKKKVTLQDSSEMWFPKMKEKLIFHPEHIFDKENIIKAATCEGEDGEIERICTTCGYSERNIVKGGHVLSEIKQNDKNHWYDCERCGEKISLGSHTYEEHILKKPNCTEDGQKEYVCTVCGYTKNSVLEKLGHTPSELQSDENEHWHECTKCGEILDITPHTYGETNILKEPTCTVNGKAEHTCTVCGYTEQYTLNALGHKPGELKHDEKKHWFACKTCGASLNVEQHTYENHVIQKPTCTEDGMSEYVCTVCGYTEQHTLEALGHKPGEINKNDKNHWYVCDNCGERIDVGSHIFEEKVISEATCTEDGATDYICSVCGYTEHKTFEKRGHLCGELEFDEKEHWRECSTCGELLDIGAHTYGAERIIKYPAYGKNGEAEHTCTVCVYTEQYVLESVEYKQNKLDETVLNIVIDGGAEKINAVPGEEVDITIKFVNNSTISSAKLILTYDPRLSVVLDEYEEPCATIEIGDELDQTTQKAITYRTDDDILILNWLTARGEVTGDTVYATVRFKIADNAEDNEFLPIIAMINPDDIFDINGDNIDYNLVNGGVEVKSVKPGDINRDNVINNKDVVALFKSLSSGEVIYDIYAYDYNKDGAVNNKDVVALFKFVSTV